MGSDGISGLDLGDDWDDSINQAEAQRANRLALPSPTNRADRSSRGSNPNLNGTQEGVWAIVIYTYTNSNHLQTASMAASRLRNLGLGPEFNTVRTHTNAKGSLVILGAYPSRDDPTAKADVTRLRSMVSPDGTVRVFPRVILTYIESNTVARSQFDLRSLRQRHDPNLTLYTLDIAVWSTFGDPNLDYKELKGLAEAYCRKLRNTGVEAYFHHNERAMASNVTVGVFPTSAVDAQSGIYSDEVMRLIKRFPIRLNNGMPLDVLKDPQHPSRGRQPQTPVLVEVPQ